MTIKEIKNKSKNDMKNNYGAAILTRILLTLTMIGSICLGFVGGIIVAGAIMCCLAAFYVDVAKHEMKGIDSTYRGFSQLGKSLIVFLIYLGIAIGAIITIGLGPIGIMAGTGVNMLESEASGGGDSLWITYPCVIISLASAITLFIVSLKLKFVFHIMNNEPTLTATQCIQKSWQITKGHLGKLVLFELSFIGWRLLVFLTLGVLDLYVSPYHDTSVANFYLSLSRITTEQAV